MIGAGITGITTAYELAQEGHAVTVYERCSSVAAEGSFATAGLVSPGSVSPAAAPGLHRWLLRGLFSHDAALHWRPRLSPAQWRWLSTWWRACGQPQEADVRAMVALARLSQARLSDLTTRLGLEFERSEGVLLLLRHTREFRPSLRHVEMLNELGVPAEPLDAQACRAIEPGLGDKARLAGGVHLRQDGVGNCRQFAQQLRDRLIEQHPAVRFRFSTAVTRIGREGGRIQVEHQTNPAEPAHAAPQLSEHDAVVVCAGASAPLLLRQLGWRMPLMPVLGHSVTFRLQAHGLAPRSAVVDARAGVAIARQGQRLRITGGFTLGGRGVPQAAAEAALRPLYRALNRWFPYAAERGHAQVWTGARPMLPSGPPVIGEAPRQTGEGRVWLNLGHGAHGWTLACGSARLLADQIAGRSAGIDPAPYTTTRWLGT